MDNEFGAAAARNTNPVVLSIKVEIADVIREIAAHLENDEGLDPEVRRLLEQSRATLLSMVQTYDDYERHG